MSDRVREQVRERYAAAALAVTQSGTNPLALIEADGCCAPTVNADCCGGAVGEIDPAFGASLYGADEQGELPAEAVLASLGVRQPGGGCRVARGRAGARPRVRGRH